MSHIPTGNDRVYVALGSNIGPRSRALHSAILRMDRIHDTRVTARSPMYETLPEGPSTHLYLNMVAAVETSLEPFPLLASLLRIEKEMGRVRTGRWSDRNIDLDIVLWGQKVVRTDRLTIPHPRMHLREFVLRPLCHLAPDLPHPVYGETMSKLLASLDSCTARLYEEGERINRDER